MELQAHSLMVEFMALPEATTDFRGEEFWLNYKTLARPRSLPSFQFQW
ncbi:MAG: hypothetical protein IPK50_13045 [Fibrobacterota bacterium]|nr:hypothetical protein [Fibrobacterota bacterium]QQS03235.1 MAG: hypothetical protein IPK50_13045 [Fibrobacterota bacterium]